MKKEFDLGWGESVAVRQAFIETFNGKSVVFDLNTFKNMGYPKHEGDPELVSLTKQIIKRQTGNSYKHVFISNGAAGGVAIALRALKDKDINECWTENPPYFRFYPSIIQAAGLRQVHSSEDKNFFQKHIFLIDSPSNPLGIFSKMKKDLNGNPIIWDTVYFNKVYCPGKHPKPEHDIAVGSYSKLTGLNGLRVGWIATNNDILSDKLKTLVTAEYCGISTASTKIILETAGKFNEKDWIFFEKTANLYLNYNREEFSKLEKYFGNQPVTGVGMFYYAPVDKHCKKLLEKSGIIWSKGSDLHHTDDYGRFNMNQDNKLIKQAVKEILKNDTIKK